MVGNTHPNNPNFFETVSFQPFSPQGRQGSAAQGKTSLITHPPHLQPATPNSSIPNPQESRAKVHRQTWGGVCHPPWAAMGKKGRCLAQLSVPLPCTSSSTQQGRGIAPVGAALQTAGTKPGNRNNPGWEARGIRAPAVSRAQLSTARERALRSLLSKEGHSQDSLR